jgi:hypothetical protein
MRDRVAELLGREPRGLEAVAVVSSAGDPMVVRVASLVDDAPFPTLYWLVDPVLNYRLDQAEAGGLIKRLQRRVDGDPEMQRQMAGDHHAHIALRAGFLSDAIRARLDTLGFAGVLDHKGIGGIADFTRIRCLHTWYAAHLIVPNTIGAQVDEWWAVQEQAASAQGAHYPV